MISTSTSSLSYFVSAGLKPLDADLDAQQENFSLLPCDMATLLPSTRKKVS